MTKLADKIEATMERRRILEERLWVMDAAMKRRANRAREANR